MPRYRISGFSRAWLYLMIIPYALVAMATDAYVQLNRTLASATPVTVEIQSGERFRQVIAGLQRDGVFTNERQARYLQLWARLSGATQRIRAAEYEIKPGTTPLGLLTLLSSNDVVLHRLTFVDGWRFAQVWAAVVADPDVRHTLPADASPAQVMTAIGHGGQAAEGRFAADTYRFPRNETDVLILRNAYDEMTRRLQIVWDGRASDLPFNTPYDALIMASIIEKETAQPGERAEIAGVFVRRLRLGMRLQADPTVIYGLGSAYTGDLTTRDLTTDTPYNSYTRAGLPPTPICLPGQAALNAAVHPDAGKALYFVSRGDGTHVFSDTLAEHDTAVERYQLHRQ